MPRSQRKRAENADDLIDRSQGEGDERSERGAPVPLHEGGEQTERLAGAGGSGPG